MKDILDAIEAARRAGKINNDAARAASVALSLTGDDAMLACRIVAQGSDPASIEYLGTGSVSEPIARAHRQGPGSLTGADRDRWLNLASISHDESKGSTLRDRLNGFIHAETTLRADLENGEAREARIEAKRAEIAGLSFKMGVVGGREMRVYSTDLGFAAAYWAGEPCAAVLGVYNGVPYLAVGSNGTPLASLGVAVGKPIAPCFGIIEDPAAVASVS